MTIINVRRVAAIHVDMAARGRISDLILANRYAPGELTSGQTPGLAISPLVERICADAQPVLDPESVEHFCQVWAEVGRAILTRRSKQNG